MLDLTLIREGLSWVSQVMLRKSWVIKPIKETHIIIDREVTNTSRKTIIGVNLLVAYRFDATPLTCAATWKILLCHHCTHVGGVMA
jgi:hypothetical protein